MCVVLSASESAEFLADAVESLGMDVIHRGLAEPDLVLIDTDGRHVHVQVKSVSTAPTPIQLSHIVSDQDLRARPDALRVLVAERISAASRSELRSHGWGWLDLRGHLHLAGQGLFIDAQVPPVKPRAERGNPLSGSVGLEVACALLLDPTASLGVRDLAR